MTVNSTTLAGNESIGNHLQNLSLQDPNDQEIMNLVDSYYNDLKLTAVNSIYSYYSNQEFMETITFHVSPEKTSSNYLELYLNRTIRLGTEKDTIMKVMNKFINDSLQGIEIDIKILTVDESSFLYRNHLSNLGDSYFQRLIIPKHEDARKAVESLSRHNKFHGNYIPEIGSTLDNLEECARLSQKINDNAELTIAQKYIIKNIASPYIKGIKEKMPNIEDAKLCLNLAIEIIDNISPRNNVTREDLYPNIVPLYPNAPEAFYVHLFGLAKIGSMWAGLEENLEQAGESLPSRRQLNDIILQTMDEAYNTVQ